jgi:PrtD family type I secretion system ABC transporter
LRNYLGSNSVNALFDAPWAPLLIGVIFLFHPLFGIIATLGAVALVALALIGEKITRKPLTEASGQGRRTGRFVDLASRNAEAVKALGMLPAVTQHWRQLNGQTLELQVQAGNRSGGILAATKFIRLLLQVVMLAAGAYLVIDQHATPGIMIAATLILARAMAPVELAISTWKNLVEARNAYGRLKVMLDASEEEQKRFELPAPEGRLVVEKVVFGRNLSQLVLRNISFQLEPGESLGLIGPSAAGKSTLARLIAGVWRPLSGAVRLDGASVSDWDPEHLGRYFGYLPQDVELFAGTVAENIARMGDPGMHAEAVVDAAKRAFAHDMILRLPNGYDTDIGEGGVILSGGQRQRIALARALYGSPRLVLLDEPNSNLDSEGEMALLQAMKKLKEDGVTLIIISHNPSLLTQVDKMLVLQGGQVEAFGPAGEVMNRVAPGAKPPAGTQAPAQLKH